MSVYLILLVFLLVYLRIPPTEIRTIVFLKASNEARFLWCFMKFERKRDWGESDARDETQLRQLYLYRLCLDRD